jgi:hypothetical protein
VLMGLVVANEVMQPTSLLRSDGKVITARPVWPWLSDRSFPLSEATRLTSACPTGKGGGKFSYIIDVGTQRFDVPTWRVVDHRRPGDAFAAIARALPADIAHVRRPFEQRCRDAAGRRIGRDAVAVMMRVGR